MLKGSFPAFFCNLVYIIKTKLERNSSSLFFKKKKKKKKKKEKKATIYELNH